MGNRCHVIFPAAQVAVYLHWNGGAESVVAFLDYMNEAGLCANDDYAPARFCQVVGNFFGGELSLGIRGTGGAGPENFAQEDNGAWVLGWNRADGLHVAQWWRPATRGETPTRADPERLAERLKGARAHPYNVGGAMLQKLREANAGPPDVD